MKKWETPTIETINVAETEYGITGIYRDGGFVGDGHISGHLTWTKPSGDSNDPSNNS